MDDCERLTAQAAVTAERWRRVAAERDVNAVGDPSDGGLLAQISARDWDTRLGMPNQARDVADVLTAASEYADQLRRSIDAIADPAEGD